MIIGLIILLAYLLGSIPSGLIIGKSFFGIDIREHGSGNLGATNSFRTLGVKAGLVVTLADILKGTIATLLPIWLGADFHPLLAGTIAVIGHMFPVFAGFRGGKAVATSGGVLLAFEPLLFLLLVVTFFVSLYFSKYVSLSSIIVAITAWTYSILFGEMPLIIVVSVLAFFVIYRHRANMGRIKDQTEPKITWM
ncbi:glycerol-3-phosphate acyltransferase PlsY [Bacillus ectoiniformans]|uniref:glycerol-3-phosphate 1-O-acyltransferase PlsY n=1 Tax=Bacillus ectoiniformans TaxID=1494429 RepID=UPI00195A6021|nr:glycerol-3-phosphate 1-O-acyltransferase PlsY [Bacillus ectoiniformans]MBM7649247.1 glycerol-3-phosphate acyltransferase PlsY [Bacillus ectoiniformans]